MNIFSNEHQVQLGCHIMVTAFSMVAVMAMDWVGEGFYAGLIRLFFFFLFLFLLNRSVYRLFHEPC